jgi:hypothetical protein
MHPNATLILAFGSDGTQACGLRVMRVVQKAGVLNCEHLLVLCHPLDRPLVMRGTYVLRCCFVIIEKPVGCFGVSPIFTSLVDWTVWLFDQLRSQLDASAIQTGILQFDRGKFITAPLVFEC